ncbi:MAG: methyltransferase, partial [Deltaproteobacteria bacterium]|nr:methyltransferase [Deltaproteobacteria bacterium]
MATSIEDTYELELVPIAIGGKRLEIYRVENLDCIVNALNQESGDSTKKFPFWVKVWEASLLLSNHLLKMDLEKKMKILEIGAGMGVTGLFLGVLGYDVTITDYDEDALALIKMNVEHNGLTNVSVRRLDWTNPDLKESFNIICGS